MFFKMLNVFCEFNLLSSKNTSNAPCKSWKKIHLKKVERGKKNPQFGADSKKVLDSFFKKCQKKKNSQKTHFALKFFLVPKETVFLVKKFSPLLNTRVMSLFETSAKLRIFWYPSQPFSKKFFSNSYL